MARSSVFEDLDGRYIILSDLDSEEQALIAKLIRRAKTRPEWTDFDNYWLKEVTKFYEARGLSRKQTTRSAGWRVAQDLSSRIAIAAGSARLSDYRDDLADLARSEFKSRREFCEATGLSEDMLSHVFAGRKHLAVDTLMAALDRIGYMLRVVRKPLIEIGAAMRTHIARDGARVRKKRSTGRDDKKDSRVTERRTPDKVA